MKHKTIFVLLFALPLVSFSQQGQSSVKEHIQFLASDSLEGRLVGSKGERIAADYIQSYFQKIKLAPLTGYNYKQPFAFTYSNNPHTEIKNKDSITGFNVAGYLNNNAEYTFVIGAHYDHLGVNEYNLSTDVNGKGEIHNGADDNASGVSAVLQIADFYSNNDVTENVNFIFVCFSGEELGLMGSKSISDVIKKEFPNTSLMINFDMIGRMNESNDLNIGGIGTSPNLKSIVEKNKPDNFNIILDQSGVGPSDHTSFYNLNIPVLFFFTGLHLDYHKPSDDANKIDYLKKDEIIDYAKLILNELSQQPDLEFTKTKYKSKKTNPKFKITLGLFPDYKDYGDGLHIQDVIEGKVAQKSGLKKGDIITQIGEIKITEIYTYMEALSKLEIELEYTLTFTRDNTSKTLIIKF